jgi:hypothetical protein
MQHFIVGRRSGRDREIDNNKQLKGPITMFQNFNIFGRKQQVSAQALINELPIKLRMPAGYQGKTIPTSIVMMELLWQQYGLDIVHPEVSRWLERNAPDVKYALTENLSASGEDGERTEFRVGPKGTVELQLPLKIDDRLREVSSQYILNQMSGTTEPQTELRRAA